MFKPGWTCLFSQIFFIFHCKNTVFKARSYGAQVTWYYLWTPGSLVFWVLELLISFLCMLAKVCVIHTCESMCVHTWRSEVSVRCLSRSLSTLFFWLSISRWIKHSPLITLARHLLSPWGSTCFHLPRAGLKGLHHHPWDSTQILMFIQQAFLSSEPSSQPWIFHFLYGRRFQGLFCERCSILLLPTANLLYAMARLNVLLHLTAALHSNQSFLCSESIIRWHTAPSTQ